MGVVNDFRSSVAEKTEVIWLGASALAAVSDLVAELTYHRRYGARDRRIALIWTACWKNSGNSAPRLISVTPIHRTLEDYFMARTREEEKESVPS